MSKEAKETIAMIKDGILPPIKHPSECIGLECNKKNNIGRSIAIFMSIESEAYSDEEKLIAIYDVARMPTHNSINKKTILFVLRWLCNKAYQWKERN